MLESYLNSLTTVVLGASKAKPAVGLEVYPNPARHEATITHPSTNRAGLLEIFTHDGRRVACLPAAAGTAETRLPLATLPAGLYLVRYTSSAGQLTSKLLRD
nr:T9SS type A sorting domain-containing protein [Hymenobacter lucidus]